MTTLLLLTALADSVFAGGPFERGRLPDMVNEASGLAASQTYAPLLWTHNDSGDEPRLYLVDAAGRHRATLTLDGATAYDWEDIAYGPGPGGGTERYIHVADIGDNEAKRPYIRIYTVPEVVPPDVAGEEPPARPASYTVPFTWQTLVYPDGPRDAETLLCDPRTGERYIVSKRERRNRLYRVPTPSHDIDTLVYVTDLPFMMATGGDIAPDGSAIIVKNYTYAWLWKRADGESVGQAMKREPQRIPYMPEPQGESVAFLADGSGYVTVSEREDSTASATLYAYLWAPTAAEADRLRDVRRPQLTVTPAAADGHWSVRYTVPQESNIQLYVVNALGMKARILADDSREAGAQDRDADLSMLTTGDYVMVLRTRDHYAAVPFTVVR